MLFCSGVHASSSFLFVFLSCGVGASCGRTLFQNSELAHKEWNIPTNLHNNSNHHVHTHITSNTRDGGCHRTDNFFNSLTYSSWQLTDRFTLANSSVCLPTILPTAEGQMNSSNSRRLSSTSLHPCAESQSQAQARTSSTRTSTINASSPRHSLCPYSWTRYRYHDQ